MDTNDKESSSEAVVGKLQARIDAALKIHSPYGQRIGKALRWVDPKCRECETYWPCQTARALTSNIPGKLA